MKKIKHVKYKNTGIIFELLSKQVASDVLTNQKNISLSIIKKYFKEGTELHKELACYQALIDTKTQKQPMAMKLLDGIIEQRQMINHQLLAREKYKLIGELKTTYNIQKFFESRVSDYKLYASIYNLFEYKKTDDPVKHVEFYETLLEHLTTKSSDTKKPAHLYEQQSADIKKLAFKMIIEKFNNKYKFLNTKQKILVSRFINENTSLQPFKDYVYSESEYIRKTLLNIAKHTQDPVLKIKLTEAANLTSQITASSRIKDEHISSMIKYYELIDYFKNK